MSRHFSKEEIQIASRHMKGSSESLIREMLIKTTMRYHITSVNLTIINKSKDSKCWEGCKREIVSTVGGVICYSHYGKHYRSFPTIKSRTSIESSNLTSRYISKENEIRIPQNHLHCRVHCSSIQNSQNMETICVSING